MSMYVVSHKIPDLVLHKNYHVIAVGNDKDKVLNKTFSDSIGDNLPHKSSSYCELTALYWLWKNPQDEEAGLCYYRWLFIFEVLGNDIGLFPIYYNDTTIYEHYNANHIKPDLDNVSKPISNMYPNYSKSFFHL